MNEPLAVVAPPPPGLYPDMPAELYHEIEAMSSGGARRILKSPAHYKLYRTEEKEPGKYKNFGTIVHCGVLEPERLTAVCVQQEAEAPKRPSSAQLKAKKPSPETLEAIDYWQHFDALVGERILLSPADFARAVRVIDAVRSHAGARRLLEGAAIEESLFWLDSRYQVPCKARTDARSLSLGGLVDLKTTSDDAGPEAFARTIASYEYDVQAAHYLSGARHVLDAAEADEFFYAFIVAETEEPHGVATYVLGQPSVLAGAARMSEALGRYAVCLSEGAWRGYPETVELINTPAWRRKVST